MASPPPRPAGTSCLAEAWGGVGGVRRAGRRPCSLDGVCRLRRGRWTRPRTRALRAAPRLGQPLVPQLAASRATPPPVPGLLREEHLEPPSPSSSPPLCCVCSRRTVLPRRLCLPLPAIAGPRAGRGAAQGAVSGGSRRASSRRIPGSAAPKPSGRGSGVQAVPGGGAREPGLEFSPNLHAAGRGRSRGQWEPPPQAVWPPAAGSGRRGGCGLRTRFRGRPIDFGSPRIREANGGEGGPVGRKSAKLNLPRIRRGRANPMTPPPPAERGTGNGRGSVCGGSAVWGRAKEGPTTLQSSPLNVHGLPHPPETRASAD